MTPEQLREIIGLGDLVLYDLPGYSFEGTVTAIDYDADLVTVETVNFWGEKQEYPCGMERIVHLLSAAALTVGVATKTPTSELISV